MDSSNRLKPEWVELLFVRFSAIYGQKWAKTFENDHDNNLFNIYLDEWSQGLAGVSSSAIGEALTYCRNHLEWPPGISEFRKLCDAHMGLPAQKEIMHKLIRRDFSHPLVEIIFKKMNTWLLKTGTEAEVLKAIASVYADSLDEYRHAEKIKQLSKSYLQLVGE